MTVSVVASESAGSEEEIDVVAVPLFGEEAASQGPALSSDLLQRRNFQGKASQSALCDIDGRLILAVGLGERGDLTLDSIRRYGATIARTTTKMHTVEIHLPNVDIDGVELSQAIAEGVVLASYRFNEYKSEAEAVALQKVIVVGAEPAAVQNGVRIAEATCLTRDLINHPAGNMTPIRLAEIATELAQTAGFEITVWDENDIERERMGGLRGVSMGSDQPPRFLHMTYSSPKANAPTVAIVGKGITFDSGGLSLKPADGMMTMKTDMSGAAAVIAVMSLLPALAPNVNVMGIACITENLPGPKATKPGDVLRARNGKTMEVLNTDAEGRLVLADGLSFAAEHEVDAIIDIATLTGACMVALGGSIAGLMSNNDALRERVQKAAQKTGEDVWHLPLPKQYRKHIDSEIADIKNIGAPKGAAGALTAGLFLQEFVDGKPWVHLDIAGPARADGDDGYIVKGATGFSVRTLVQTILDFDESAS